MRSSLVPPATADDVVVRPPVGGDEIRMCAEVGSRAFGMSTQGWYREGFSLGAFRPDGRVVACLAHGIGQGWWGGDRVPMGFVGGVGTDPGFRDRGYAGALMAGAVHHLREIGQVASPLWPFSHRWYGKLGWALASADPLYRADPRVLRTLPASDMPASLWPAGEWPRLLPLYERFARRYNACTVRDADRFRHAVAHRRIVVCRPPGRPPRGYAVFSVSDDGKGIRIDEFIAEGQDAECALLQFFARRKRDWVQILLPADTTLLDLFPEPYRVGVELHKRISLRVLDAEAALLSISPPPGVRGIARFAVRDPVVNARGAIRFAVRFEGGRTARVPSVPRTATSVRCDIRAFSQFFAGFRTARQLAARDRLECDRPEGFDLLDRLIGSRIAFRSGIESG